jgi:hypothetical protein
MRRGYQRGGEVADSIGLRPQSPAGIGPRGFDSLPRHQRYFCDPSRTATPFNRPFQRYPWNSGMGSIWIGPTTSFRRTCRARIGLPRRILRQAARAGSSSRSARATSSYPRRSRASTAVIPPSSRSRSASKTVICSRIARGSCPSVTASTSQVIFRCVSAGRRG